MGLCGVGDFVENGNLLRNFASWEFFRHPGKLFDFSFKIRKSILKIKSVIILKHFVSATKKEDSWRKQFN